MSRPRARTAGLAVVAVCVVLGTAAAESGAQTPATGNAGGAGTAPSVAAYYQELERLGLVDVDTGTKDALIRELRRAEEMLLAGASIDAAVALYAIVESPRFSDFDDFVEYQNAEYYLAVALATAGAYESALDYLERSMARGPSSLYYAPAHRRAVDIALETRDYAGILARIEGVKLSEPIPPEATGERAYLRARIAYEAGKLDDTEGELARISRKSRLYSSALYLRGVIRARRGQFVEATEALCEIVDTPDDDRYSFVVDGRYFTIKDLARLGLGRIAHEESRYDDAYYHYFQIPDDSDRLAEALFEAAWSMYQKHELPTARDLVREFLTNFPDSPLVPEARLLAGYVELADCEFDAAQNEFDAIVRDLQPVVDEVDRTRKDSGRRSRLFDKALERWRAQRVDPKAAPASTGSTPADKMLHYLRLHPRFVRLHDAVSGLRRAAGDAPHNVRAWRTLGRRVKKRQVAATGGEPTIEEEDAADAAALLEDVRRLRDEVGRARAELRRGVRAKTLPLDAAAEEEKRLDDLEREIDALEAKAQRATETADAALLDDAAGPNLASMIRTDLTRSRALLDESRDLSDRMLQRADQLAVDALDKLYAELRRVLDKAKLGKIDAVIGQKRKLDIEVSDLAAGRYPPELTARMWELGLIGDDEEYWPFEGEYWADEYEGWR